MNAHPHSVPLAVAPEIPSQPETSRFAQNLIQAARTLLPQFEAGKSIEAAALRAAMEDGLGTAACPDLTSRSAEVGTGMHVWMPIGGQTSMPIDI